MIGSYISKLPSGQETGVIYALDMGGSNYRVVRVNYFKAASELNKSRHSRIQNQNIFFIDELTDQKVYLPNWYV